MYFSDRIKLRTWENGVDSAGFEVPGTLTAREVWADAQSVKRSEFYAAQNAGVRVDVVFAVRVEDYAGEVEVEHAGVIYDVVRSYKKGGSGTVEINCARR